MTHERELTTPVDLCRADGTLAPDAIGWSRRPLHRCRLPGPWGRRKRWDYWAVASESHVLSITCADFDYLGLAVVAVLDVPKRRWVEHALATPFGLGIHLPDTVGGADLRIALPSLAIEIIEEAGGTRLRARARNLGGVRIDADVLVAQPPGHETLSVVIPWSERRFQFTSKHNTRPAEGWVRIDGEEHRFDAANGAFGCLDFGRGVWPYRTTWNWASAAGVERGRAIGLQLGGKWTDGTGMTENAVAIDGRLTKIGEDLEFQYNRSDFTRPWRIRAPRSGAVDLTFAPAYEKRLNVELGLAAAKLHVCFGHFEGHVVTAVGERIAIGHLFGWAEEMRARW